MRGVRKKNEKNCPGQRRRRRRVFSSSLLLFSLFIFFPYLADRLDDEIVLGAPEPCSSVRALWLDWREKVRKGSNELGKKIRATVTRTFRTGKRTISPPIAPRLFSHLALQQLRHARLAPAVRGLVLGRVAGSGGVGSERAPARAQQQRREGHQRRRGGRRERRRRPGRSSERREGRRRRRRRRPGGQQGRAGGGRDGREDATEHGFF